MNKLLINFLSSLLILVAINVYAQQEPTSFSLEEAINYALENNLQVKKAGNNVRIARKKVWETTAMGLPQISGSASYQKFIKQPVNLLPARIFNPNAPADQYIPVKFGTEQNMKWGLQLNQLIFNGSYIVGLYSSRTYKKISELGEEKTRQKIREAVTQAYTNVLMINQALEIVDSNLRVVKKNLFEIRQMYENGLVELTDVQQLEITLQDLENQRDYLVANQETAYQMLNYVLGRELDLPLVLTDDIDSLADKSADLNLIAQKPDPGKNIDIKLAKNQVRAGKLQMRYEQSQMLPSVVGFLTYGKNAYGNDFKFFDKDQNWYEQSLVGISINIPLFGGFARQKKIGQAKLKYLNAQLDLQDKERKILLEIRKTKNDYQHAIDKMHNARKSLQWAREIEKREQIKYKEGVGSSMVLNQSRLQLYRKQQEYLQSVVKVINLKIKLENLLGIMPDDKQP